MGRSYDENIKDQANNILKLLEKWFKYLPLFEILSEKNINGYTEDHEIDIYFNNERIINFAIEKGYEDDGSDLMVKYIRYQFENVILDGYKHSDSYYEIYELLENSIQEIFSNFRKDLFDLNEDYLENIVVLDIDIYSEYAKECIEKDINLFKFILIECLNDKTKNELDYLINAQKFDLI